MVEQGVVTPAGNSCRCRVALGTSFHLGNALSLSLQSFGSSYCTRGFQVEPAADGETKLCVSFSWEHSSGDVLF